MDRRNFLAASGLGVLGVPSLSFGKNKNVVSENKNKGIKCFNVEMSQLMLQMHDKRVITDDHLEELLHMNFKTGEMEEKYEEYWNDVGECVKIQFLNQLYDRQLISNEVLLEKTFGKKK